MHCRTWGQEALITGDADEGDDSVGRPGNNP